MTTNRKETLELTAAEIRLATDDEDEGRVTATSPYGQVDHYRSVIMPGAFRSAMGKKIPMLLGHDPNEILGHWEVTGVEESLQLRGRLNLGVRRSVEVQHLLRAGDLAGVSVGFRTEKDTRRAGGIREIRQARLVEVSFVTFPAVPGAAVTSARTAPGPEADFIKAVLRAAASLRG